MLRGAPLPELLPPQPTPSAHGRSLPVNEPDNRLQLYIAHRSDLIDYAAPIVGGRSQAEDVVQDAWLRFSARSSKELQHPLGYLYRIVRNLAFDLTRRSAHEQFSADPQQLDELQDYAPSPEIRVCDQDALQIVAAALEELPERTRLAFQLHRLNGMPMQQIATQLNISVGLTHQLVHQALRHCSERLDPA